MCVRNQWYNFVREHQASAWCIASLIKNQITLITNLPLGACIELMLLQDLLHISCKIEHSKVCTLNNIYA